MLELAMFTGLLSSVGSLIKIANESKNFELTNSLIELQQKILAMQGTFGELQQKLFDAQQENRELEEKLRGADDTATFAASLKFDESQGVYFRNVGGVQEAYCSDCLNEGNLFA